MSRWVFFIFNLLIIFIVHNEATVIPTRSLSYDASVLQYIENLIRMNPVMVFSKSYCSYSQRAKNILSKYLGGNFAVLELDQIYTGSTVYQDKLQLLTGERTVPRVFIGGKFVGGADQIEILDKNGNLKQLLRNARVISK